MKNLTLIKSEPPRLYDTATGNPIRFYNEFMEHLWSCMGLTYQPRSVIAMEKCARVHTEFLFEAGILSSHMDAEIASKTMHLFGQFLVDGDQAKDPIVRDIAIRTGRKPMKRKSAQQYIATANTQLRMTSAIILEAAELRAILFGAPMPSVGPLPVLAPRTRSKQEMEQLHANTLQVRPGLSQATKTAPGGLRAPKDPKTREIKHIAVEDIMPILDNAPNPLAGVIWAMSAAGGLRFSETIGTKLEDIDVAKRTFSVHDPRGLRSVPEKASSDMEAVGFKGRKTSTVTMFEPFKSIFWKKLADYLAIRPHSDSEFLLLSIEKATYGTPLYELKGDSVNRAINRQIQDTQARLGLSPNRKYSSHHFRHFYGIWGRNYVWVPGRPRPGLDIKEMQTYMGHASIKTTETYAVDLGLNGLVEIEAANELIYHKHEGENIDYYRGHVYARIANQMLSEDGEE